MTGYGKAEINLENVNFTIEVKSLNSKQIDATLKMSSLYRDKEIGIRNLLAEKLHKLSSHPQFLDFSMDLPILEKTLLMIPTDAAIHVKKIEDRI